MCQWQRTRRISQTERRHRKHSRAEPKPSRSLPEPKAVLGLGFLPGGGGVQRESGEGAGAEWPLLILYSLYSARRPREDGGADTRLHPVACREGRLRRLKSEYPSFAIPPGRCPRSEGHNKYLRRASAAAGETATALAFTCRLLSPEAGRRARFGGDGWRPIFSRPGRGRVPQDASQLAHAARARFVAQRPAW